MIRRKTWGYYSISKPKIEVRFGRSSFQKPNLIQFDEKKKKKKNCKQLTKRKQMPHLFAWLQPERLQRRLPFFSLNVLWICSTKLLLFWISLLAGFVQSLVFLKKSGTLPSNFPDLEKVWKIDIKSGKNRKKSWAFWQLQHLRYKWIFFRVSQIVFNLACTFAAHRGESFVPAFFFSCSPVW